MTKKGRVGPAFVDVLEDEGIHEEVTARDGGATPSGRAGAAGAGWQNEPNAKTPMKSSPHPHVAASQELRPARSSYWIGADFP